MTLFLLVSNGEIIGQGAIPASIEKVAENLEQLDEGIFKEGKLIVSHEILSTSGQAYRLAAVSEKPLAHFVAIPWAGLTIRVTTAIFISGLICYLLSVYLTHPLRSLRIAASSIAKGNLNTRVHQPLGHRKDEIAELNSEFNRMAEQLEALVHSKERLLQDISHELRSPLARLHIAIELGRKKTGEIAEAEFQRMEMECQRLNQLIGEILEFARLDKSTTELQPSRVDLPQLLGNIIQDANFEFGNHSPRVKAGKIIACQLELDERLIHRSIENILRNALRYSDNSQPVRVSLTVSEDKKHLYLDIEDHGPGVPPEQLQKIFNPFYRVDSSREKKTGGYGLGLAIAEAAVNLHQGKILAQNRDQGGLLVRIILPLALADE